MLTLTPQALTPKWTRYIPVNPTPKQYAFLLLNCLEAMYGGSAGGGKSAALLMAALQYVDVPGYAALILRRTYSDLALPGALIPRSHEWLRPLGVHWDDTEKTWTFPSGATLTFGYLDHSGDRYRYQSSEFQFCVTRGTPVLMADGSWEPIEAVTIGDMVATLEGPRCVVATHTLGMRPVCQVLTPYGEATIGAMHRLLLASGVWASPMALLSRQSFPFDSTAEASWWKSGDAGKRAGYQSSDQRQVVSLARLNIGENDIQGFGASLADGRSDCEAFDDARQVMSPPLLWCGQLALFERGLRLAASAHGGDEGPDEHCVAAPEDSPSGYRFYPHCDDVRARQIPVGAPENTRLQDDVAVHIQSRHEDGLGHIRKYNPHVYVHPYTLELRRAVEHVLPVAACIVPVGEAEVQDLTVSLASHYIVFPGIIAQNCAFDEATQFQEDDYRYLFSRLRRLEGSNVPLRMRAASNPGNIGHDWVKRRFLEEGRQYGRVFIPARLDDNPYLDRAEYVRALSELDPVTRAQLLDGDWTARAGGSLFLREWFPIVDDWPRQARRLRYWDLAATAPGSGADPDYTVGLCLALDGGIWYCVDMKRRQARPAAIEALVCQTAELDGKAVAVRMEQEPGASGVNTIDHYHRRVLSGYDFQGVRSTGSKIERARPVSSAAEAGNVRLVRGPWIGDFLDELEAFPLGPHDDAVDALSGAMASLSQKRDARSAMVLPGLVRIKPGENPLRLPEDDPRYWDTDRRR